LIPFMEPLPAALALIEYARQVEHLGGLGR
jgi:hypothetical protein